MRFISRIQIQILVTSNASGTLYTYRRIEDTIVHPCVRRRIIIEHFVCTFRNILRVNGIPIIHIFLERNLVQIKLATALLLAFEELFRCSSVWALFGHRRVQYDFVRSFGGELARKFFGDKVAVAVLMNLDGISTNVPSYGSNSFCTTCLVSLNATWLRTILSRNFRSASSTNPLAP